MNQLQPIGPYLKRLDEQLTEYVDGVMERNFGLSRRHWQTLRTVNDNPGLTIAAYAEMAAASFDEQTTSDLVSQLSDRGWLAVDRHEVMTLTSSGKAGFKEMAHVQETTWSTALGSITEDEYLKSIQVLDEMANNLEAAVTHLQDTQLSGAAGAEQ